MKKRYVVYALFLFAVFYGVYSVFQAYKPKNIDVVDTDVITYNFPNRYSLARFEEHLTASSDSIRVIFFDRTQVNSQYFFNNTWPALLEDNSGIMADRIIYVDVSDNEGAQIALSKLGYRSLPALENLLYENGGITVSSILQEHGSTSLTADTILKWLTENELLVSGGESENNTGN
ncbi:MAG: hypothetical protein IJM79_01865 [Erysipelotrichaceae bacterium]|nr:hypothetical protein [Erysipelotrichaceae bacterium]